MSDASEIELTILMPCLNEAETLAACIQTAKNFLQSTGIRGEVLIADNGSTDNSQVIARESQARLVTTQLRGYGAAIKCGIENAAGKFIIMGDADCSYDFSNLMPFVEQLRAGGDLVMGNRFRGGIKKGAMPFLNRYLGNPVLSLIGRLFFKSPIGDFHCGLRGFRRASIQRLELQTNGMEFASEMVVKASLHALKIGEVPTTLSPDGRTRRPHLRPWRDGWRHLKLLLLLSPRWLFLYPGIALMVLGAVSMASLAYGPVKINGLQFDIHTMLLSSMAVIIGMQAIFFFVFARFIAIFTLKLIPQREDVAAKFCRIFNLERGVMLGLAAVVLGCAGFMYAFRFWMHNDFGDLIPAQIMRLLIPAFTFLIAGMQIIFASFFMSALRLHYNK
jgi:glycosyltransferase involved in cell wall biosynthesis